MKKLKVKFTPSISQRLDNSAMILAILFLLTTMESLENGLQSNSGATPSMTAVSLASLQSCHSVDSDAQCKRALKACFKSSNFYVSSEDRQLVTGLF